MPGISAISFTEQTRTVRFSLTACAIAVIVIVVALVLGRYYERSFLTDAAPRANELGRGRMLCYRILYLSSRLIDADAETRTVLAAELQSSIEEIDRRFQSLRSGDPNKGISPARHSAILGYLDDRQQQWANQIQPTLDLLIRDADSISQDDIAGLRQELEQFIEDTNSDIALEDRIARRLSTRIGYLQFAVVCLALVVVSVVVSVVRSVSSRITSLATVAGLIADGELEQTADTSGGDEIAALGESFNAMTTQLNRSIEVNESRAKATLDSAADAVITIEESGTVISCNAATERMFGYSGGEVVGLSASTLSTSLYDESAAYQVDELRPGEVRVIDQEFESSGRRKDGSSFPVTIRVTEMEYSGERLFIATIQDITGRKQDEQDRNRLFHTIHLTASQLSTASDEISATMHHESQGIERQASAVSRTVSAVGKAAQTAEQSTNLAKNVAETARTADDVGKAGRKAIEKTRLAMNNVNVQVEATAQIILTLAERAQAIGEIIEAVNDIAEQTNVLALNAAVEAARAGVAGKGFSVVASEVKSLSEQAKKSTGQVRGILTEIQNATNEAVLSTEHGTNSVKEANTVVADAETTIDDLGTMVGEAARAAAKIVAALRQQSAGMSQVTDSMDEIDRTAKETLTATKQTSQAADDLNLLGRRLQELIRKDALTKASDSTSP